MLIPFAEAHARLLAGALAPPAVETVPLEDAFHRVLARDLASPLTVPPFDNAAMDGYAYRAADLAGDGGVLPVGQRIAAGDAASPLAAGTAARIFTGAQLPAGADTVVMQEDCRAEDGQVTIQRAPPVGANVRQAGSDLAAGQTLLRAGDRLSAAALGLAASVGIARLPVFGRLKVAIFFTGSELVPPGQPLPPGCIYNSNRYVMRGFLQQLGVDIVDLGIVRDEREATRRALREAAARADVILTSGGMSEGDEDHVTAAVREEGRVDFWKIAAKPGKPLAFGTVRDRQGGRDVAFIGLPGNPVAVWVGLLTLGAPFLRRCQGLVAIETPPQRLRADFEYRVKGNRLEYVRVRRNADGGLDLYPNQDSAVISSAVWADGVAVLPAGAVVTPGTEVAYLAGPAVG